MAYSDYGAYVYCNGDRREDKEDCVLFEDIKATSFANYCHGVMGDVVLNVAMVMAYVFGDD